MNISISGTTVVFPFKGNCFAVALFSETINEMLIISYECCKIFMNANTIGYIKTKY